MNINKFEYQLNMNWTWNEDELNMKWRWIEQNMNLNWSEYEFECESVVIINWIWMFQMIKFRMFQMIKCTTVPDDQACREIIYLLMNDFKSLWRRSHEYTLIPEEDDPLCLECLYKQRERKIHVVALLLVLLLATCWPRPSRQEMTQ